MRRADFSDASLLEADFTNARIGVRPLTAFVILFAALVVSIAAGVAIGLLAETVREQATSSDWRDIFGATLLTVSVFLFFVYLIVKGISRARRAFLVAVVLVVLIDFAVVFVFAGEIRYRRAFPIVALLVLLLPAAIAGILDRRGRRDVRHMVYRLRGGDRRARSWAGTRWHGGDCGQHASRLHL